MNDLTCGDCPWTKPKNENPEWVYCMKLGALAISGTDEDYVFASRTDNNECPQRKLVRRLLEIIKEQNAEVKQIRAKMSVMRWTCECGEDDACHFAVERDKAQEKIKRLLELCADLRTYTHDWDWKHGEEWDAELKAITKGGEL